MRTAVALSLVLVACADAGEGRTGLDSGNGSGFFDSGSNQAGCGEPAKLIWTLESNKRLAKFDPTTGVFTNIGVLNCPGSNNFFRPFSMAVDRSATAWVLYSDYTDQSVAPVLFKVDTTTLGCTATSWTTQNSLREFGMGFSTDEEGGTVDTLFVSGGTNTNSTTSTLATLSTDTIQSSVVGTMSGWAELTGNAKAELWAFLPKTGTPRLERINKTTGATLETLTLTGVQGSADAWAFASWGGDFWLFYKSDFDPASIVYQVDATNGAIKSTIETNTVGLPRTIIGAGVSTCAPVILL